mgnify:CR=1 FL=1|tara:strand:- start:1773 stop:1955 length:183 start_codon:yes stop_codon:yes gene_type:complete
MEGKESIAERLEAIRKNIGETVVIRVGMYKKNTFDIISVAACYPENKKSKKKETSQDYMG